jgi:hypothetical protein
MPVPGLTVTELLVNEALGILVIAEPGIDAEPPKETEVPFKETLELVKDELGIPVTAEPGIDAEPPKETEVPFKETLELVNEALGILVIAEPGIDAEPPKETEVPFNVTELFCKFVFGIVPRRSAVTFVVVIYWPLILLFLVLVL